MKKLFAFILGVAAISFASCTSDEEIVSQQNILSQNVATYGTRSSEVKVYLSGVKEAVSFTRSCDVNGNTWPCLPATITDAERNGVMAYIASQPESVEWPGWTYFYLQHVGGAHHTYSYYDFNHALHSGIDGTSSMETLQVLENNNSWVHVNNFNCGKCDNMATHNSALMTCGLKDVKAVNEYSSSVIKHWKLYRYNGCYYIGIDFDMKKGDGEISGDEIYDDWVIKVIPGLGEKDPADVDPVDPIDNPDDDPSFVPEGKGSVEVDIHHQEHKDWNEIKTSIHLRDTANVRVFIPVEKHLQAVPDDFDIRTGEDYTYFEQEMKEVVKVAYVIAGVEYTVDVQVNHRADGIEILVAGADCAEALKAARGIYDDGITFEIHSYLYPDLSPTVIWEDILKKVEVPETSLTRWPGDGSCITYTYGQIHSAYFEDEMVKFAKEP